MIDIYGFMDGWIDVQLLGPSEIEVFHELLCWQSIFIEIFRVSFALHFRAASYLPTLPLVFSSDRAPRL